jgi:hypothetical protein
MSFSVKNDPTVKNGKTSEIESKHSEPAKTAEHRN